ncbi:MAG TPA: quinoprotein relay system zinc metallohydrolase 2 [Methylovirgula sp.]|nr:quinoprotein relay system zinc metallohydrolase 2 [Methylovirgula sp.]
MPNPIGFICVLAVVLAAPAVAHAAGSRSVEPLEVREVAPGVYAHQAPISAMDAASGGDIGNSGFIIGDEAVAVIDTGGAPIIGVRLKKAIEKVTDKPIRYVINTHEHPDHIFGNGAFVGPGVTFVGHRNLPRSMAVRGPLYIATLRKAMGEALIDDVKLVPPTLLVDIGHDVKLDLGHRIVDLRAWPPMHTDCDLTVFDEQTKTLFTGDLVFLQHVPVIDASVLGWIKAMPQLAAIPARLAVPGHGPVGVDWPQALAAEKTYFAKLTADLRGLLDRGADINEAAKTAGSSEAGKWQLFGIYNPRNATAGYAELEWK